MGQSDGLRLLKRFGVLGVLLGCLWVVTLPAHVSVLAETCQACSENRYTCLIACDNNYDLCLDRGIYNEAECALEHDLCLMGCQDTYNNCLTFCTGSQPPGGGGGGGGGGCGRGRTPCERACATANNNCMASGTDAEVCDADYDACMTGCCP